MGHLFVNLYQFLGNFNATQIIRLPLSNRILNKTGSKQNIVGPKLVQCLIDGVPNA